MSTPWLKDRFDLICGELGLGATCPLEMEPIMTRMRSSEIATTFRHPFLLAALETTQPAGTYRLVIEEEQIPGLSFLAWRRSATLLHLPALSVTGGQHQVVAIDPLEWAALVEADERD